MNLLIFDLDGTLVDSKLDLVHSVNAARGLMNLPPISEELVSSYVGSGVVVLMRRALGPDASEAEVERAVEFFLGYYRDHMLDNTRLYPSVQEGLDRMLDSGARMAVLTNKPVVPSRQIVESLKLGRFFMQIYGGNSFATKKPDPEGALKLVTEAGVRPEETVIVGDSHVDVETGINAGLWTVAVSYGFAPHTLNSNPPDVLLDAPHELAEVFA